jgi:hypothetical protein
MTNSINPQKEFEKILPNAIKNACFSVRLPDLMINEYDNKSYDWAEDKKNIWSSLCRGSKKHS